MLSDATFAGDDFAVSRVSEVLVSSEGDKVFMPFIEVGIHHEKAMCSCEFKKKSFPSHVGDLTSTTVLTSDSKPTMVPSCNVGTGLYLKTTVLTGSKKLTLGGKKHFSPSAVLVVYARTPPHLPLQESSSPALPEGIRAIIGQTVGKMP